MGHFLFKTVPVPIWQRQFTFAQLLMQNVGPRLLLMWTLCHVSMVTVVETVSRFNSQAHLVVILLKPSRPKSSLSLGISHGGGGELTCRWKVGKGQNGSKWLPMAPNSFKWLHIDPTGTKSHWHTPNRSKSLQITPNSFKTLQICPNCSKMLQIAPNGYKFLEIAWNGLKWL